MKRRRFWSAVCARVSAAVSLGAGVKPAGAKVAGVLLAGAMFLAGCGSGTSERGASSTAEQAEGSETDGVITIGVSQVGEESDWRRANSVSIKETFTAGNGFRMLFDDAQGDPDKQIKAIQNFVQQQVDYIVLEPIIETGWDTVLAGAQAAGIPVIVADRQIVVKDDALFTAWVGSDCLSEGRKAAEWLNAYAEAKEIAPEDLRIVNIQGTIGSTPQIERDRGLMEGVENYGWTFLGAERGEFTQAKGRETMTYFLEAFPELNVVYCDNDNSAYGAIEAIEAAGRKAGCDIEAGEILIISFDATEGGLRCVMDGTIACDVECNPLHGPRIREIIMALEAGRPINKKMPVTEGVYAHDGTVGSVNVNGKDVVVHVVTEELLANRVY